MTTTNQPNTLPKLAEHWATFFERRMREGEIPLVTMTDGAPEELQPAVQDAHGDMFPDDWRYLMIETALDSFGECEEDDGEDELRERAEQDFDGSQWMIYTWSRLNWLSSRLDRASYVDEFIEEHGYPKEFQLIETLAWGMFVEFQEVAASLLGSLKEALEAQEEAEEEEVEG